MVPDQARLFERLSGAEMLEYAGRLRGMPAAEARSRATQLLDVLDLTADAKRLVADYSTGMRKKAMLGCALIHNPSVLFLDEPLEGVDPVSADVIRRLLTRFTASGSTGFALALAGVRIAAVAAERRLPELAQIAIRSKL